VEFAKVQRDQMSRKLEHVMQRQEAATSDHAAQEQAGLVAEVTRLRNEVERLRQEASTSTEEDEMRAELAALQSEISDVRRRQPERNIEEIRTDNESLRRKLDRAEGTGVLLQQVLEERDAALQELSALSDRVESMQLSRKPMAAEHAEEASLKQVRHDIMHG
jgi:cytochrome c556